MSTPPPDARALADRHEAAVTLARDAGRQTLERFQATDLAVERKRDGTVVTEADRNAEAFIRDRLAELFPDDGVLGEEHGERPGTSGWRWVLDPIDGTVSFVHGVPLYGTLVAVEWQGTSHVGVIEMPALGERVHAATGRGAIHARDGQPDVPARVSDVATPAEGLVCMTGLELFRRDAAGIERYGRVVDAYRLTRGWNDCYAHLLAATGRADAVVEPIMALWDVAAMIPIMAEAGGICTGWDGGPAGHDRPCVSSNGHVHAATLELLVG
jgi:histidinol phosphatase-like enzyme (inositol monophosphatase family)